MANLKDISRQIKSVKNTQKTTKAMKLVSSAKLRKAQQLSQQSKAYAIKLNEIIANIGYEVANTQVSSDDTSRALIPNDNPKVVDIVFVTADKGLCGGFNITTIKKVKEIIEKYEKDNVVVRLRAVGRKGVDYFNFQGVSLLQSKIGLSGAPEYAKAEEFISEVIDDFNNKRTDKVILIHNGFLNMLSQELKVQELLPISLDADILKIQTSTLDIEPDEDGNVLDELIEKYINFNMYFSLIDSLAAEYSARMQAMDSATNNAREKVESLTIEFNKARQASITTELIEIISGVEALK